MTPLTTRGARFIHSFIFSALFSHETADKYGSIFSLRAAESRRGHNRANMTYDENQDHMASTSRGSEDLYEPDQSQQKVKVVFYTSPDRTQLYPNTNITVRCVFVELFMSYSNFSEEACVSFPMTSSGVAAADPRGRGRGRGGEPGAGQARTL